MCRRAANGAADNCVIALCVRFESWIVGILLFLLVLLTLPYSLVCTRIIFTFCISILRSHPDSTQIPLEYSNVVLWRATKMIVNQPQILLSATLLVSFSTSLSHFVLHFHLDDLRCALISALKENNPQALFWLCIDAFCSDTFGQHENNQ